MKSFARLSLMGSGLGLFFLTAAVPSFATVVGNLNTGGNGTVTVTATAITFTENDSSGGSTEVATGTTLTYAGGPALAVGQPIDINMGAPITAATLAAGVPVTFPDEPSLSITLDSFGPGSSTPCSSAITVGESCSPELSMSPVILSPIILTETATGTSAALAVAGTATDGSGVSDVSGNFSATITGKTPEELSSLPSFTTTSSGTFVITATSAVPEPRSISLVLLAGLLMGVVVMRRKKSEA
jgi:hypothetical protein